MDSQPPPPCPPGLICDEDQSPPILIDFDCAEGDQLCPGEVCTLVGLNFSTVLDENRVVFSAGRSSVEGLPLVVRVDRATGGGDLPSELDVLIPGGISTGNVELFVQQRTAGAAGYDACPMIMAHTLEATPDPAPPRLPPARFLCYGLACGNELGFQDGASQVTLYGLNFNEVEEVIVSDSSGNSRRIPSNTFIRNPGLRQMLQPGNLPTGYESLAFNLMDENNDIRLPFLGERGNLGVELRSVSGTSNRIEVPVSTDPGVVEIGAVISGIKIPTGVVTGPVAIHYTMYELAVDAAWTVHVDWNLNPEDPTSSWYPALPKADDPENDGIEKITAGTIFHGFQFGLLPGGGARRTFIWDACNDPNFVQLNEERETNVRYQNVVFRLRPEPETDNRERINHTFVSPPIVYYYMNDRANDPIDRTGMVQESFRDDSRENSPETTARWGPPDNRGSIDGEAERERIAQELSGTKSPSDLEGIENFSQFGEGLAVVKLENMDLTPFPDAFDQFWVITTDSPLFGVRIEHHLRFDSDADGAPDVSQVTPLVFRDPNGREVGNPGFIPTDENVTGSGRFELHVASFEITEGTVAIAVGDNPLVIRVSGGGENADDSEVVFQLNGILDLNGVDGENGADAGGRGGSGGPGAGAGGQGASIGLAGNTAQVGFFLHAQPGNIAPTLPGQRADRGGGGEGESPAAVHFDPFSPRPSVFAGAPGGGGGHRLEGLPGEYGSGNIPQYRPPRPGTGGVPRGSDQQIVWTAGSGGGGGGASVSNIPVNQAPVFAALGGAGGGGGGGSLRVAVRGAIEINGEIQANGGNGGVGTTTPTVPRNSAVGGSGGGGSGGTMVLEATGPIRVADCTSLQVNGGLGGGSGNTRPPRGGDGSPGWIRLASADGGTPVCTNVSDTVTPAESLSDGGLTSSAESADLGFGRDGALHLRFIESVDFLTGETLLDEQTGRPVALYTFNTDTGELSDPTGAVIKRVRSHASQPGFMDLVRLSVDEDAWMVAFGENALEISVREVADIRGVISVSGFNGGALRFPAPGTHPQPGIGGVAGAGGGRGGDGGMVLFLNGDAEDKDPANTHPIEGALGGLPPGTEEFDHTSLVSRGEDLGAMGSMEAVRPLGGASLRGQGCGINCVDSAGGGGGGGNLAVGENGQVVLLLPDPETEALLIGRGGSAFGPARLRFEEGLWLKGGMGGSGGGASANVSNAYAGLRIPCQCVTDQGRLGDFPFRGRALYAPGTGGGGGGGFFRLSVGSLYLHSTARLLARGGDAYQSIDLGGNGGGGAGGNILIQVANAFMSERGAVIDVSGGRANRLPPNDLGGVPLYEGNVRQSPVDTPPSIDGQPFGGLGGGGAPGRVRIETPFGGQIVSGEENPNVVTGLFLKETIASLGVSQTLQLGLGPGGVAASNWLTLDLSRARFNTVQQPPGTAAEVLWEGARESLDRHAMPWTLHGLVTDARRLRDGRYVRFTVAFLSNYLNRTTQSIREITMPYELECLLAEP